MELRCYIFPFVEVEKNEKVIIWGMGYVGKQYVEEILRTKYCEILFAVDQKYEEIEFSKVRVDSPECIRDYFDARIVIAQSNNSIAAEINEALLNWGVEKGRIIYRPDYIVIEDAFECQIISKLNSIYNSVRSMDGMKNIFMSIESDLRDWRDENNGMTKEFELAHYKNIHQLMNIKAVEGFSFTRVGNKHDGGYVLLDSFRSGGENLVAYSFGISNDVSWDKHMACLGYDVFMYDHTIQSLPEKNNKFHFFKQGITDGSSNKNLKTLEQLIKINQHESLSGMILKMDVEGAEYGFLENVESSTLEQFDQIILELHGLTDIDITEKIVFALKKINKTHQLVHIHANNYARIRYVKRNIVPDTLEVLYVLKDKYQFREMLEKDYIQSNVDAPCWNERIEIETRNWNQYTF